MSLPVLQIRVLHKLALILLNLQLGIHPHHIHLLLLKLHINETLISLVLPEPLDLRVLLLTYVWDPKDVIPLLVARMNFDGEAFLEMLNQVRVLEGEELGLGVVLGELVQDLSGGDDGFEGGCVFEDVGLDGFGQGGELEASDVFSWDLAVSVVLFEYADKEAVQVISGLKFNPHAFLLQIDDNLVWKRRYLVLPLWKSFLQPDSLSLNRLPCDLWGNDHLVIVPKHGRIHTQINGLLLHHLLLVVRTHHESLEGVHKFHPFEHTVWEHKRPVIRNLVVRLDRNLLNV